MIDADLNEFWPDLSVADLAKTTIWAVYVHKWKKLFQENYKINKNMDEFHNYRIYQKKIVPE